MRTFVDSSFFIALTDKSDRHFRETRDCFISEVNAGAKLVTNNMVLAETITRLRYRAGFKYARDFGEKFRESKLIQVIWINPELEQKAWELFLKYSDHELSYIDCLSFACMRADEIDRVLTFDKHFKQVGFITLPILA